MWVLTYLSCTALFFYQLLQILPNYFSPTLTHTEVKEVPLKEIDFPLDFKICFKPSIFNRTALNKLGYRDTYRYKQGMSKFNNFKLNNSYVIGWGGHKNQSGLSVKNASEVLEAVKWDWDKKLLFDVFQISTNFGAFQPTVSLQKINPINECFLIDINMTERNNFRGMRGVLMYLNETILRNNITVELQFQGRNLNALRDIQDHVFHHIGDAMKLGEDWRSYRVKMKKRVFVEGEPGRTCRNYPNSEFESYMESDDK